MPYTGVVLSLVAAHAALFLVLLGHWMVAAGLFPKATRAFAGIYDARPLRATLLGVFTYGPLAILFLQNAKIPGGFRILVVVLAVLALLIAFIGSTGLALRIGRNLSASGDLGQQVLRGGVMLALVFITPILGWLFLLHIGLASGFGAFFLAKPWKGSAPAVAPVAAEGVTTPVPALS